MKRLRFLLNILMRSNNNTRNKLAQHWTNYHRYVEFLFSGRTALLFTLKHNPNQKNKIILIPDYICNVVNIACEKANYRFIEYALNKQLSPSKEKIIELIKKHKPDALIIASIYGSSFLENELINDTELRDTIRQSKTLLIYDLCQDANLINLTTPSQDLPYVAIGSFNDKIIPGIMGAVICSNIEWPRPINKINSKEFLYLLKWAFQKQFYPKTKEQLKNEKVTFEFSKGTVFPYDFEHEGASNLQLSYAYYLYENYLKNYTVKRKLNAFYLKEVSISLPYAGQSPYLLIEKNQSRLKIKSPYARWNNASESKFPELNILQNNGFKQEDQLFNVFSFSGYTNAWSLQSGLTKLGLNLNIKSNKKEAFLKQGNKEPKKGDVLLFTDESSLFNYYNKKNDYYFLPNELDEELIDDKLVFANRILELGESPVYHYPSIELIKYPCYLKSRKSWLNGKRLPKGKIIHNETERLMALETFMGQGYEENLFFYQKLMNESIETNVSVSGYFNYKNQDSSVSIITSKLFSARGNSFGTGAIIQTIPNENNLRERAYFVLNKLNYEGPFELEFYLDEDDKKFKILELNPRFWMQHGIFVDHLNNCLIGNYFGVNNETINSHNLDSFNILWVDGSMLYEKFPSMDFWRDLNMLYKKKKTGSAISISPDFRTWFLSMIRHKLKL